MIKPVFDNFDQFMGTGLRLEDGAGGSIAVPSVLSTRMTQGRQASYLIGNSFLIRDVEPSKVTIKFRGGELTLDLPLRKETLCL